MLYQIAAAALPQELRDLGMNQAAVPILAAKGLIIPYKLAAIRTPAANIIKQEMLAAGGDCAVPAGCVTCAVERVDVILLGTRTHYKVLLAKLKQMPYFGIPKLAGELEQVLAPQAKLTRLADGRILNYEQAVIMGIINITPDSFYAPSRADLQAALTRAEQMLADGTGILDVGGASTRPGTELVTQEAEQQRVVPVLRELRRHFPQCVLSVDTYWAATAAAALAAGADIINDVSAMAMDKAMLPLVVKSQAPVILMHMRGTPKDMQQQCDYRNVVQEVTMRPCRLTGTIACYRSRVWARTRLSWTRASALPRRRTRTWNCCGTWKR
jgi:dihydropteroate synthase